MGWHRFTKRAYLILCCIFLLIILGGYAVGCATGTPFGLQSSTGRGPWNMIR